MKTRIVHTKIWRDAWYRSLSRDARELFIFAITNPYINLSGLYELDDEEINLYTKIDDLEAAKVQLSPKVKFYKGWVLVEKAAEFSGYKGSKNEIAMSNELRDVPEEVLSAFNLLDTLSQTENTLSIPYKTENDTPINHKSEIINHKSEIEGMKHIAETLRQKGIRV